MDQKLVTASLIGLLFLNAICAGTFALLFVRGMRDVRQLQGQAANINNLRNRAQGVLNEALEYSKRNPAIDPILQSVGAKPRPAGTGAATGPAPAPPGKTGK